VQNQLNELRAADLRFSIEEAEQFFARTLTIPLPTEMVRTLDERAEGWAAGLRLASLSLQDHDDPQLLVAEFSGTQRHVMDFLLEQVLAHQPPEVVTFLLFTSPLEMLSAPLCNEVLAGAAALGDIDAAANIDSRAILNYLARSNLFLVALDSKGHWYRYHHLFRDMLLYWLKTQHPPATIERIHRQAAVWFAHNGLLEPALRQLLTIDAVEEAGDLIELAIPPSLGREAWHHIQELLGAIPDEVISRRPVLLLAQAWLLSVMQRMHEVTALLHQVEELLYQEKEGGRQQSPPWLAGWVHALWSLTDLLQWRLEAAIAHAQQVLALTPLSHVYVRGIATTYYALALRANGHYAEALALCAQAAVGEQEETQHRILASLGMLSTYQGDLHGVRAAGEQNLRAGGEWKVTKPHAWGHVFMGSVEYETNNLEAARQHLLAAYEERFGAAIVLGLDAAYGLALTFAAQGDKDSAAYWAGRMAAMAREAENVYLTAIAAWFASRLALNEGAAPPVPSAHLWCVGKTPPFQYRWTELPDITYARLLIAQGTRAGLAEAVELMQRLADWCERYHFNWRRIEALAVLALAQEAQGYSERALAMLEAAIALAQPQPYVRTFVDLGPPMAKLLHALAARNHYTEYLGRILAAFPTATRNTIAVATAAQQSDEIIEPLSEREMEVLGLLAERLSDKEIAERLRISPLTVRRHSVNLYQKLHVNSRRQAVSRAQALGLIRSPT
jgi:LuxR family maltose regulon positive regulatory protein